jgi:hypothetical protein
VEQRRGIKCLTYFSKRLTLLRVDAATDLIQRREIEDELLALGVEREALTYRDGWIRERIRRLIGPAREAGITMRDTSRLTGMSTQTLHTWMKDLMRPIPDIHLGLSGPQPPSREQAVLRTMGQDPDRDWTPDQVKGELPTGWPGGSTDEIRLAMERLARGHMIWDGEVGYRVAPPEEALR